MVNSSPEYAITKPGMNPELRKRKPLRTYGKRQSLTPDTRSEPPAKKHKPNDSEKQNGAGANTVGSLDQSLSTPTTSTTSVSPDTTREGRGSKSQPTAAASSILKYFKPVASLPKINKQKSQQQQTQQEPPSSPPSSPPPAAAHARRKPRLLRIRPASIPSSDPPDDTPGAAGTDSAGPEDGTVHDRAKETRKPLGNTDSSSIGNEQRRRSTRRKPVVTVQTTLNISSRAAFSECKECDTVWNPMYPDDVKYHKKRHTAVTRAKKRKEMDITA